MKAKLRWKRRRDEKLGSLICNVSFLYGRVKCNGGKVKCFFFLKERHRAKMYVPYESILWRERERKENARMRIRGKEMQPAKGVEERKRKERDGMRKTRVPTTFTHISPRFNAFARWPRGGRKWRSGVRKGGEGHSRVPVLTHMHRCTLPGPCTVFSGENRFDFVGSWILQAI